MRFPPFFLLPSFIICLIFSASSEAVTVTEGPKTQVSGTTATITWTTDVACGTKVNYGTDAKALTQKAEGEVAATHTVAVSDLKPGVTYYFTVGSARTKLATGSFTTTGAPGKTTVTAKPSNVPVKVVPKLLTPPATRATWGNLDSLPDHFARHGGDFNAKSADDYAAQAWLFLQRAKQEALPMKWDDADGTLRVWDPKTKAFAAYSRNGKTRTYFKPGNADYWTRQPGRSMKPAELPF